MESSTSPQLWWLVTQPCQNIGGLRRYFSSLYSLDFLIESEFGKRVPLLFLVTTCLFLFNLGQAKDIKASNQVVPTQKGSEWLNEIIIRRLTHFWTPVISWARVQ
ncbi:uncharacterized protein LOC107851631 isoform X2 [Capsicum annuum]|uniref:uncharacterized protein LOC107851631 isoform X2 n=1 Tax=Capsicum annuum TaxID=4072 RepID=UPI001FB16693|nr:uncharacterized protein LOC107851631 isoform X2 [Capsicum annuum]